MIEELPRHVISYLFWARQRVCRVAGSLWSGCCVLITHNNTHHKPLITNPSQVVSGAKKPYVSPPQVAIVLRRDWGFLKGAAKDELYKHAADMAASKPWLIQGNVACKQSSGCTARLWESLQLEIQSVLILTLLPRNVILLMWKCVWFTLPFTDIFIYHSASLNG